MFKKQAEKALDFLASDALFIIDEYQERLDGLMESFDPKGYEAHKAARKKEEEERRAEVDRQAGIERQAEFERQELEKAEE